MELSTEALAWPVTATSETQRSCHQDVQNKNDPDGYYFSEEVKALGVILKQHTPRRDAARRRRVE